MRDILEPPNDWGHDQVAAFVDGCRNNVLASFQRCPEHYRKIVEVDTAFRDIAAQLLNPMSRAVPFFVLKAHSSFLGAAHLAMAGQTPESFMLMRGCLEAALYGLYLDRNPDTAAAWINRHDTDEERAACRNAFTTRKIFACLETTDPDTNRFASTLYERTIDLGAHPNVASLAIATTATRVDDRVQFRVAYLAAELPMITGGMKSAAQSGLCALLILRNALRERFDLIGLTERLPALRSGL